MGDYITEIQESNGAPLRAPARKLHRYETTNNRKFM